MFTTDELCFDGIIYDTIWLRVRLHDFCGDKKYKTLARKNSGFRIEINKALITPEHEALFTAYKKHIPFEGASSLHSLLHGDSDLNVFNTFMINMFDGDKLIGTGCFDLGNQSVEGIFSVYDPAYKNYSLGKFMIYEKMHFCKREGFTYFYPGYFVPGYPMFDYKKEIGREALEYLDRGKNEWYPMERF